MPSPGPAPQVLGFHPKKVTRERRRSENSTTAPRRRATSADTAPSAFARSNPTSAPSRCRTRMGEPQCRHHANPLAQAPHARRRRHHHARPPTSPPAEANGPDRPSPPRPDLKPRDAVASRQPRAAGSPSPARGRGRRAGQPPRRPETPRTSLPPPRAHAGNRGRQARGDPRRHCPPARASPGGLIRRRREGGRAVEGSDGGVPRVPRAALGTTRGSVPPTGY